MALGGQEGEAHAAANDQAVDPAEEVVEHGQLVGDLAAPEHGRERPLGVLQQPRQHLDLVGQQVAGVGGQPLGHPDHRGVGPVGGPEGVVHVDLGQGGEPVGQVGVVLLLARLVAEVLEQQHLVAAEGLGGLAGLVAGDVVDEQDLDAEVLGQDRPHRLQRVLRVAPALGPAQVGAADHLGAVVEQPPQGRDRGPDAQVVGDVAVLQGHVEVVADQDPPPGDVGVVDRAQLHRTRATGRPARSGRQVAWSSPTRCRTSRRPWPGCRWPGSGASRRCRRRRRRRCRGRRSGRWSSG